MTDFKQWQGFEGRIWKEEVNTRDFIQKNYRPYNGDPRNDLYCPVGRGDPTPPGDLAVTAKRQGGVKTPPYE